MIDRIIAEYIQGNKRLVIPEFGAFIRKENGQTVFVEYLKKNDGVLSGIISRERSISEEAANVEIATYVAAIKQSVKTTGTYDIEGLGRIYMTQGGIYELESPSTPANGHHTTKPNAGEASSNAPTPEPTRPSAPAAKPHTDNDKADTIKPTISAEPEYQHTYRKPEPNIAEPRKSTYNDTQSISDRPTPNRPARPAYKSAQTEERQEGRVNPRRVAPRQNMTSEYETTSVRKRYPDSNGKSGSSPAKKNDIIIIIAIVAAAIAFLAMIFGLLVNNSPVKSMRPVNPQIEQVDTIPDSTVINIPANE